MRLSTQGGRAAELPTQFVERLSLLDRGDLRRFPTLFIWLTTSREFQSALAEATSRNERILLSEDFELRGPLREMWPSIIEESFEFHNNEQTLADYEVLTGDISALTSDDGTIGQATESVGAQLGRSVNRLQDLSQYQVIIVWPVVDAVGITRIASLTNARDGYRLNWNAWFRSLNPDDQRQLPAAALNRARLYFDVRLVPLAAADMHPLCRDLDDDNADLHQSYLDRFGESHLVQVLTGAWNPATYSPMREREDSGRARDASAWYATVTRQPTLVHRRIARILSRLGLKAEHEQDISSPNANLRADVLVRDRPFSPEHVILEFKLVIPRGQMPSRIGDAVRTTLRRHAQFAGFLPRQ